MAEPRHTSVETNVSPDWLQRLQSFLSGMGGIVRPAGQQAAPQTNFLQDIIGKLFGSATFELPNPPKPPKVARKGTGA